MSPKTVFLVLMLAYFAAVAVATLVWRPPREGFANYAAELAHFKALPPAGRAAYLQMPRAAKLQLPVG